MAPPDARPAPFVRDAVLATIAYAALTVLLTWPLARGLAHDVAGDFGDPVFESWVMAWDATHLGRGLWNANIFYPHPLTLAYSEHLLPQAVAVLPVYRLTGNPLLGYNLVLLSTFILSGAAMFLLARDLTGSLGAAFVAGLAYACAPYRFASVSHMQVLSSQWMPLALLGFRRFFATGRRSALAGAAAAWTLQNLSCLYYVVFFTPVIAMFLVWELTARRLWRSMRVIMAIVATCAAVAAATAPFLWPYAEVRRLGVGVRSLAETDRFSADTYAYLTASPQLRLLGPMMQAWPRNEGQLFPGVTIVALALIGTLAAARLKSGRSQTFHSRRSHRIALQMAGLLLVAIVLMLVALLFGFALRLPLLKVTSVGRVMAAAALVTLTILVAAPEARGLARRWLASPPAVFTAITAFAIIMSLGPHIHAKGRTVADPGLYAFFYDYIAGFDGVRVPARFGMLVAFGLATLAAFGTRALAERRGQLVTVVASTLIVAESFAVPLTINDNTADYEQHGLAPLPATLALDSDGRAAYDYVAALPPASVVVELPLGEPALDVRYMLNSTRHWKPLVNGYSGSEPEDYAALTRRLQDFDTRPDRAWDSLKASGATHVVVHEALYESPRGHGVLAWLRAYGAREATAFGRERIFQLR